MRNFFINYYKAVKDSKLMIQEPFYKVFYVLFFTGTVTYGLITKKPHAFDFPIIIIIIVSLSFVRYRIGKILSKTKEDD